MIPESVVEEAVVAILKGDTSSESRIRVMEEVRLTLEIAETHLRKDEEANSVSKPQWAIFGASSPVDAEPIIPPRFSSRESAQTYIKDHFPSPQFLQVRSRTVTGWAA